MTLRSFDWMCVNPIEGGKPACPHFHLYVTGSSGNVESIENLDFEDLAALRDAIAGILEMTSGLQPGAQEGGEP